MKERFSMISMIQSVVSSAMYGSAVFAVTNRVHSAAIAHPRRPKPYFTKNLTILAERIIFDRITNINLREHYGTREKDKE